ncbi:cationic amino acid transporter 2, partial [Striga asiatica]
VLGGEEVFYEQMLTFQQYSGYLWFEFFGLFRGLLLRGATSEKVLQGFRNTYPCSAAPGILSIGSGGQHEAIHTYPHAGGPHVGHASIPLVPVVNTRCSLLEVYCPSRLSWATLSPASARGCASFPG